MKRLTSETFARVRAVSRKKLGKKQKAFVHLGILFDGKLDNTSLGIIIEMLSKNGPWDIKWEAAALYFGWKSLIR